VIGSFRADADVVSYQVRSWFGAGIQVVASHPAVQSLTARWMQIRAEREPTLADFWHDPPESIASHTILFLKGESDYTYLHHGRALRDRIGFSMQGLRLGELRTRVREELVEIYDRCAASFEPAYFQSFADFQQDVVLWGRLCLPLRVSADDPRVALFLYCHPIEDKASLYRSLFEHSAAAILIAAPVRDELGAMVDAWIVAENAQAARLTGEGEHATATLLLRGLPLFASEALWHHLAAGLETGLASATLKDKAGKRSFMVEAEAVNDYVVLRLVESVGKPAVFTVG